VIEKDNRPVNLNLLSIKLPIIGVASIMHRVSAIAVFFCFPLLVWLLSESLYSVNTFNRLITSIADNIFVKLGLFIFVAGFTYHVLAGIKKIFSEVSGIGEKLQSGKILVWIVFGLSFLICISFLVYIW
jgi:succinate dehydrogenase / fumarate reductase cytochrome b subunit